MEIAAALLVVSRIGQRSTVRDRSVRQGDVVRASPPIEGSWSAAAGRRRGLVTQLTHTDVKRLIDFRR